MFSLTEGQEKPPQPMVSPLTCPIYHNKPTDKLRCPLQTDDLPVRCHGPQIFVYATARVARHIA